MTSTHGINVIQPRQKCTPSKVKLIICNRFPGFELVSPFYTGNFVTCYPSHSQNVDAGSTTQTSFEIGLTQKESIGVLMYKLQRKNIGEFNEEDISSEDEATWIWLVMIWKVYKSRKIFVVSDLIEHDKSHIWNSNELMKLNEYYELFNIQHGPIEETWLMHDNTVLTTSLNTIRKRDYYVLEVTISEGSIRDDTKRLRYIGLDM
jgi:hypothetical protein